MITLHTFAAGVLLLASAVLQGTPAAAGPVVIDPGVRERSLGSSLEFLEDRGRRLDIHAVSSREMSSSFVPSREEYPGFGLTRSAYWARFTVVNRTDRDLSWYLELAYPHTDHILVYRLDERGALVSTRRGGDTMSFGLRPIRYMNFVYPYMEKKRSSHTYYVRFETTGAMNFFLTMWNPAVFNEHMVRMEIILAVYYGAMLVMLIYNLFIFFSTWDRSYLYYVFYCLSFIVFQLNLNGLSSQYLWPSYPWWTNHSLPFWIMLCLLFAVQFFRYFLESGASVPKIDRFLKMAAIFFIVAAPASILVDYTMMVYLVIALTFITAVFLYAVSVRILLLGNRSARIYIITWATFWACTVIYALKIFSILPDTAVTRWMLQISSLVQVVLLSLGLADKINSIKERYEELNLSLESKVRERTSDLDTALKIMEKKEKDIQVEFELAGNIQQGILPATPFYYEGISVVSHYQSMGRVGGDFFDIFQLKGGYIGVLIADASGHGMPAAFITALAKISFSEAIQKHLFPADILRHVNNDLIKAIKTDDFVTGFLLVIGPGYDVFYSNASHQMALVLRSGTGAVESWDTNGFLMGTMQDANRMYEDGQDHLEYGDRVLMYTDGVINAVDNGGKNFGEGSLRRLLADTRDISLERARDHIVEELRNFIGSATPVDDMSLVMVEIDPAYRQLVEYREQGFRLMWRRQYSEAVALLEKALAINPNDETSHLYIGECYLKDGEFLLAVEHLQHYLLKNEVDANVWYNLGRSQYCLGEFVSALKSSTMAISLRNNFVDAMILSGQCLKKKGDPEGARKLWERVLVIDSKNEIVSRELRIIDNEKA